MSAHSRLDDSRDATAPETEDFALVVSAIPRRCVTPAEVTLLTAATAVGFVALVSLAAAHLHQHSLPNVAIGSAVLVGVVAVVVLRFDRPAMRMDAVKVWWWIASLEA